MSRLSAALDRLQEAALRVARRRALRPLERRLERGLAKAFRAQRAALMKRMEGLRPQFPAVQEAAVPPAWEPTFNLAAEETWDLFLEPLRAAVGRALTAGARRAIADIGIKLLYKLTNPRAVDYLEKHGAELVRAINETTREYIRTVVTNGTARGWSYDQVASAIIQRYREFIVGKPQAHIDSRAHGIAVTEMGNAYCEGNAQVGQSLAAAGLRMEHRWVTMHDDRVSEICLANEAQGWIPLEQPYESGDMRPLAHPY